jgi:hypothetical protein
MNVDKKLISFEWRCSILCCYSKNIYSSIRKPPGYSASMYKVAVGFYTSLRVKNIQVPARL